MIKVKFLKYHNHKAGEFFAGTTHELEDATAEQILKDFPERATRADAAAEPPKAGKGHKGKATRAPENK